MRKIYLTLLAFIGIFCSSHLSHAQITGHSYSFPPSVTCTSVHFTVNTLPAIDSTYHILSYWGDGTASSTNIMNQDTTTDAAHVYTYPGPYTVKHILTHQNQHIDSVSFTYQHKGCQFAVVKSYYDDNNNCNFDGADYYLSLPITVYVDSANIRIDTLGVNGGFYYPMLGTAGTVYNFKPATFIPGTQINCPASGVIIDTTSAIINDYDINSYSLISTATGSFDIGASVTVRAGRHHALATILVTNKSSLAQNGTLTLNFSPKYSYQYANPSPASINGNTLTWNLNNLSMKKAIYLKADFEIPGPPQLTVGDTVHSSYYLTPTAGDANITNNIIIHEDTVVSSFDPNYIDVMPKGNILAGTKLTYSVEFENTGNAPATNIYVLDTLPASLLPNTLDIVNSSAYMEFSLNKIPSGQYVAKFDFPNINLLDSSHHDSCTGTFIYTINTVGNLPFGTYIPNRVGIYFDDNEVVMTNTAVNRIGFPQSINTLGNVPKAEVYPNPVTDILTISTDASAYNTIEITNTIGQTMLKQSIKQNDTKVNVKALPTGIYFANLKGEAETKTIKFEKL